MKSSNIILPLVLCLMLSSIASMAQGGASEMDQRYVPPANSIFRLDKKASSTGTRSFTHSNIIKLDVAMLSRGVVGFEYERVVFDPISVTAGFGLTILPDYILAARTTLSEDIVELAEPILDRTGLYVSLGGRYNLDQIGDAAFTGLYVRQTRHHYVDEGFSDERYTQVSTDFIYMAGTQVPISGASTLELGLGSGYRFLNFYTRTSGVNGVGNPVYRLEEASSAQFFVNFYLKFGLGF